MAVGYELGLRDDNVTPKSSIQGHDDVTSSQIIEAPLDFLGLESETTSRRASSLKKRKCWNLKNL